MTKTIGILGLGSIGKRHAKNLVDMGHVVFGYDPEPPTSWANKLGIHLDKPEIISDKSEAIIIATPTAEHTIDILCNFQSHHILVEKPIGDGSQSIAELAMVLPSMRRLGKKIMVGTNLRFHPCVKQAKEWLAEGIIDVPLWANFTLGQRSIKPPYLRDGVILNWGAHEIDLALYLLGDADVTASSTKLKKDNATSMMHDELTDILLVHKNDCRSTIHLDYLTCPEIRQSIIVGTKATIIFDLVNHQAWLRDKDGTVLETLDASVNPHIDVWNNTYVDEIKAFIDYCDGKETFGATGEDGIKVLTICLKVRENAGLK